MPDYHAMYFKMAGAAADAVDALQTTTDRLILAQQEAEELLLSSPEPVIIPFEPKDPEDGGNGHD